jgi:hypothetical protein
VTDTIFVRSSSTATLIVAAGDPPSLVSNPGPNTVYLGDNNAILATDASGVVPLAPNGFVNTDGSSDLYGNCAAGQSQTLNVLSGATNFFSPPSLAGLGGIKLFVQTAAPAGSIPLNSLWFNTTLNALEFWNGAAWQVQAFAGNEVIVANTIGVTQLIAGLVYAGIVNGTEIDGATFKVKNASGAVDILLDSGTDAIYVYADTGSAVQGAIQAAIAAAATTDPINATNVPQGLFSQQLTLANQSSDPPAFSGSSIFFSTVAGRPAYKSSAGARNIIQRSDVNVTGFTLGNSTTLTAISSTLTYSANEGAQGSEYEIEVDLTLTTGTTATALTFQMTDNGTAIGPHIGIGATMLAISSTFFITLRARLVITNPGTLAAAIYFDGGISKSANVGSESAFPVINASMQGTGAAISFDPTGSHALVLAAQFSATSTGQSCVNNGHTRVSRRFLWLSEIPYSKQD